MSDREHRREADAEFELSAFAAGMTASESECAADLSAVQADDALLDALGGSDPRIADGLGDQELNALLLAWRRDIDSEPLAELVDVDTAVTTVKTAALVRKHSGRSGKRRLLVPVAAAAAVLAIAFTGTGLAARDAQPGDTLWGLTKVLYGDHARSVEAAATAKVDLEKANLALADNRLADARRALDDAQAALSQVSDADNRDQLIEQHRQLSEQLQKPGAPTQVPTSQLPSASGSTSVSQQPPAQQPSASPTSLPGGGTGGTIPPVTTPPPPTTPPPVETTTPVPPTTSQPPGTGSGTDPGSSPRYEPGSGSGQPQDVPSP
ncbi:anti-sigma-D factor RsdA [Amycolatopsis sp. H20-H5]|uniref:anti-sigma-D factor RsdA n=1 Tax=Amycolatopsis sp. H20-H5 TaxID=3046309 RepID=UPI002DB690AD|nr:anti-sigma-D factor RsdA [Amycolatopsis sp. H20-H5]MEC3982122.1 anti-sigma-D factor RsdA [Amycolatopsis sp. H20-H5]